LPEGTRENAVIHTGLVSVSFRDLSPSQIAAMAAEAGLDGIEWGGDVHAPHGDRRTAEQVRHCTLDAGLQISSYGSYYRVACTGDDSSAFETVLESAVALQAPVIRVWAGNRPSAGADEDWWSRVVEDTQRIAAMTAPLGIGIAFEFHGHSLTDTTESTLRLLYRLDQPTISTYWQPPDSTEPEPPLDSLKRVSGRLSNLHVHYFVGDQNVGLDKGKEAWRAYFAHVQSLPGDRYALLEFVPDNTVESFMHEAKMLKRILT
jgi:sugar phosphate isomerase/epimerase